MTITLWRGPNAWMARYSGPGSERIKTLFGTTTIPTAWTPRADRLTVLAAIQRLNPEMTVQLSTLD